MQTTTMGNIAVGKPAIVFESHLREHAHYYFREFKDRPVNVQLLAQRSRLASTLYKYHISAGELKRSILIKMPPIQTIERQPVDPDGWLERPRIAVQADLATKQLLEYTALAAIQRYFERLGDPRFDAIKPLDYLPEYAALIMEALHRPNLRQLFAKKNRLQQPFDSTDLLPAFRNAGAWLRYYQALPKETDVQVHLSTRKAFAESITRYTGYLEKALHEEVFFQKVEKRTISLARALLIDDLPGWLGHGDYAMRNILVGNNNCIAVIDTLGRWQVPVYEDIGYFLVRLKAVGPQIFTFGYAFSARQIAEYEKQFLLGYFGSEEIPFATIRLFEIQALLDNWSAHVERLSWGAHSNKVAVMNRVRLAVTNRFLRKLLCSLIDCRTLT